MDKTIKLWISSPCYAGTVRYEYMLSVMKMQSYCLRNNIPFTAHLIAGESLICRNRNDLVNAFLKSDYTHYLSWDVDIEATPEDVLALIKADKDIIGATYRIKNPYEKRFVVDPIPGVTSKNLISEVENLGTGLLLIKRHVFTQMMVQYPEQFYVCDTPPHKGEERYAFFDLALMKDQFGVKRAMSEDYFFCSQWRKMGGKVYLHPTLHLKHWGFYPYD